MSTFQTLCRAVGGGIPSPVDGSAGVFIKSGTAVLSSAWTMLGADVLSAQSQYVYNSGVATACTISSGGFQEIRSGGVASDCQYFAHFAVRNGGLISGGTAVHNNGSIGSVYVGGVLTDITIGGISSWNAVYVHGVISSTTFLTAGELWLRSGGTAMGITVGSSGGAYAWTYGGLIMTADGAYISGVTFSGGYMSAVGPHTLVEDLKIVHHKIAPSFYSSAVCSGAVLYPTNAYMGLNTGASAYDVVISGGTLALNQSATYASNVQVVGSGARIMGTGTFENVLLSNTMTAGVTYAYIQPLCRVHSMRLIGSAQCSVYSGATATDVYLEGGPTWGVSRPLIVVINGGYASGISTGGNALVYIRGNTDDVYIESNTSGYVSSGVVLNDLVMSGGTVWVYTGATLSGASICSGATVSNILSLSGCSADDIQVGLRGYVTARVGATATNIDIPGSGWLYVSSGCYASHVTISGVLNGSGSAQAAANGIIEDVTVLSRGRVDANSAGIVSGAKVSGGLCYMYTGGSVVNPVVFSGVIQGGGIVYNPVLSGGSLNMLTNASANNVTVLPNARMYMASGTIASVVVVSSNGRLTVSSGASALDVTSNAGAIITVSTGGYITYA